MKEIKTKEDVFKAICNASRLGNLGFFVGSGFTKAILEIIPIMKRIHGLNY